LLLTDDRVGILPAVMRALVAVSVATLLAVSCRGGGSTTGTTTGPPRTQPVRGTLLCVEPTTSSPLATVVVPNVTGLSADEAQRLLACVGLSSISFVSEFGSTPRAATDPRSGIVASQIPKAGTSVSPATSVNLVLAPPRP
jgi:hypothetical protein